MKQTSVETPRKLSVTEKYSQFQVKSLLSRAFNLSAFLTFIVSF